jgi:hypothetical protein
MKTKLLIGSLFLLLLIESGYIVSTRHAIARFKPVDVDSYLAFDSATGQLCKTFRQAATSRGANPAPTSIPSSRPSSGDPILDMIQGGNAGEQSSDVRKTQFLHSLPVCADIR